MEDVQKKKLTGAAAIVMSSIIVSRFTGFLREMLIPNMLGTDGTGDAYVIAFRITGLMYDMLVGGAIAAALIPILSGYLAKNQEEDGWKAVGTFINVVFIAMAVTSILGIIFAPQIVDLAAAGFKNNSETKVLATSLTRILFPSVAFLMLAGLTNGVLNSYHKFAAAAYGPSIYNVGSALSILILSGFGVKAVAFGVMGSSCVYFLFQLSFAVKNLKFYKLKFYFDHPGFKKLFKLAIPSLLSSSIVQINVIVTAAFTTFFKEGSVTALQTADRIWQMPYGVFAQGMGIAMLPTLSAKLAMGEVDNYKNILMKGLKTVLLLSIPSAIGFIVLKDPIIGIFKFTSKFDTSAAVSAGNILMFFSIALLSQSIVTIINRAYYANNDTLTPLLIGAGTIGINIALSYWLKGTALGVAGMALSYSIASAINAVLLLTILNKKMKGIYLNQLLVFLLKVVPASLSMGCILYVLNLLLPANSDSKVIEISSLILEIVAGAAIYFVMVILIRVEEARNMAQTVIGKVQKVWKKLQATK